MIFKYRNISNRPLTFTLLDRTEIVPYMGILEVDEKNNRCRDVVRFRLFKWLQPLDKRLVTVQTPIDPVPEKRAIAPIEPATEMSKAIINEELAKPFINSGKKSSGEKRPGV